MFLANIRVISSIGSTASSIYSVLLEMESTFPALASITKLLNIPIDPEHRMELLRKYQDDTREQRQRTIFDELPIEVKDFQFNFKGAQDATTPMAFNGSGSLVIQQGEIACLIGPRGEGKSTLLRILGGVHLPKPGGILLPSHLRVLHVSSEPMFFQGSLLDNLVFGVNKGDEDGRAERVLAICSRLEFPEDVMHYLTCSTDIEHIRWDEVFSQTQKALLCFARALVANPEVMCIHKPTMVYDEESSKVVLSLLKEFRANRGVEEDPAFRHRRRPRTCIMTSSKLVEVEIADQVYHVSHSNGIRNLPKENGSFKSLPALLL